MLSIINESDLNVDSGIHAIKFWATWCQPCKMMDPMLDKLEKEFDDVNFLSVDVDHVPSLAKQFKIKTVPTIIIFENGQEVNRISGLTLIDPMRKIFREISNSKEKKTEETSVAVAV
jgi:thioredoxin 1